MACTHIGLKPRKKGSIHSVKNNLLFETIGRRYRLEYIAVCDNRNDGIQAIYANPDCPKIGSQYGAGTEIDPVATCVEFDGDQNQENPFVWDCYAEFDTDRLVSAITDNPLNQPPDIRWGSLKYEIPLVKDLRDIPIVNSSNEPFDPPFTIEQTRRVLTIVRNEATYDPAVSLAYEDAVNLYTFAGAPPYCAKINTFTGQKFVTNGITFWQVTYEIEFRRESFALYALDQGFRGWVPSASDPSGYVFGLFRDPIDQTPLSNPTLLNGRGHARKEAKTKSTNALAMDPSDNQLTLVDSSNFPPAPNDGTKNWRYQIRLGVDPTTEVCTVLSANGSVLTLLRGQAGTPLQAWGSGATVTLEPYYLRYLPSKVLDFGPLNLPVI